LYFVEVVAGGTNRRRQRVRSPWLTYLALLQPAHILHTAAPRGLIYRRSSARFRLPRHQPLGPIRIFPL